MALPLCDGGFCREIKTIPELQEVLKVKEVSEILVNNITSLYFLTPDS